MSGFIFMSGQGTCAHRTEGRATSTHLQIFQLVLCNSYTHQMNAIFPCLLWFTAEFVLNSANVDSCFLS